MGSLYKKGNRFYAQFQIAGQRRQFSLHTSSKRTAQQLLRRLERACEDRSWNPITESPDSVLSPSRAPQSLTEQIEAFLESRSTLRPRTQETYRQVLERWSEIAYRIVFRILTAHPQLDVKRCPRCHGALRTPLA